MNEQYEIVQDIRERERKRERVKDSGSIANNKICFEIRATALRPRLHIEGFSLYVHTGLPTQRTSTEDLGNTTWSTQLLSLTIQPLHKRQGTKPHKINLTIEG